MGKFFKKNNKISKNVIKCYKNMCYITWIYNNNNNNNNNK